MRLKPIVTCIALVALAFSQPAHAQKLALGSSSGRTKGMRDPSKWIDVKPVVNPDASFMIRVEVNKPDRIYYPGEPMTVTVVAEKDCYLYLLYFSGERAATLFPNQYDQNNFVPAKKEVQVPGKKATFVLEAAPPFGKEVLLAVATLEPVDAFGDLAKGPTEVKPDQLKDFVVTLKEQKKKDWAECRIEIITSDKKVQRQPKRFAVCIGIGPYKSDGIEPLQVSHLDAERFAEALRQDCGVDDVVLLTNEQATRAAIEQALFQDLASKTEPGDTVFIFYSGHGWRVADTDGDEQDGFDEVLVPFDAEFGKPETMIVDDEFARYIRELDGCNVGIVLDNCYSGGSSKSLSKHSKGLGKTRKTLVGVDFLDGEVKRAKDLGQAGTMVLAACQAGQLAWEMPSATQGSVLTYHMLQLMGAVPEAQKAKQAKAVKAADTNGDGQLSMGEVFAAVEKPIQDYVKQTFQEEQTPVLLNNALDRIVIKP